MGHVLLCLVDRQTTEAPMSIATDDDKPRKVPIHEIGQDLGPLSLEEIDRRIEALKLEIERLAATRASKQASKAAADLFFKT
jgi:uncharacterized small protein (DUF1192 family)